MHAETLRKLAADLRVAAENSETEKMIKCGQALLAARALHILREKVRSHV